MDFIAFIKYFQQARALAARIIFKCNCRLMNNVTDVKKKNCKISVIKNIL